MSKILDVGLLYFRIKTFRRQVCSQAVSELLDSQLKGPGFESHLILGENCFKAMPRSIPVPDPGKVFQ